MRQMSKRIGILVIGNEILDGIVLNTNSQWIINRLKPLNFNVKESITVRDDTSEIAKALNRLLDDGCDLIFTTGGLGPTFDDTTLQGIAEALNLPLEVNEEALKIVTRQYREFHKQGIVDTAKITDARRKMAILPRGAKPLDNKAGGAPGVLIQKKDSVIIALPGVPKELIWIFDNQLLPMLKLMIDGAFTEKIIHLPLKDESTLSPIIDEAMKKVPDVYVKSMVKPYGEKGIRLWISARGENQSEVEERIQRVANILTQLIEEKLPKG